MLIADEEQMVKQYTIEEKQGKPMYKKLEDNENKKKSATNDGDEDVESDDIKKRKFTAVYNPNSVVAPPEYPFAYLRLKKKEKCIIKLLHSTAIYHN